MYIDYCLYCTYNVACTNHCRFVGADDEERCRLFCRVAASTAYYQLKEKVVDGTPCAPDKYDICVNGMCEKAGCDHVLGSDSQLDLCGVCGGNNSSCQQVVGTHNSSAPNGYSKVLRIPAGSSNLDIRQHGHNGSSKDDNYLALVDSVTGEYVLNGNYVLSTFNKVIVYGGTVIEYSGSDAPVERINSSRPLNKDVTVEVRYTARTIILYLVRPARGRLCSEVSGERRSAAETGLGTCEKGA